MHIENYLIRHQANYKFKEVEPVLPEAYDETKLHEVLTAVVRRLDQSGHTPTRVPHQPIHAGVVAINLPVSQTNDLSLKKDTWMTLHSSVMRTWPLPIPPFCIFTIQLFQNSRYQRGGGGGRGSNNNRPGGATMACFFAP
jgi:hypothetical protein